MGVTEEKTVKVQEGPGPGFRKSTTYVRDEGKEYIDWKATSKHFVEEDANVATHLAATQPMKRRKSSNID